MIVIVALPDTRAHAMAPDVAPVRQAPTQKSPRKAGNKKPAEAGKGLRLILDFAEVDDEFVVGVDDEVGGGGGGGGGRGGFRFRKSIK